MAMYIFLRINYYSFNYTRGSRQQESGCNPLHDDDANGWQMECPVSSLYFSGKRLPFQADGHTCTLCKLHQLVCRQILYNLENCNSKAKACWPPLPMLHTCPCRLHCCTRPRPIGNGRVIVRQCKSCVRYLFREMHRKSSAGYA